MECFAKIDTAGYKERMVDAGAEQGYCRCGLMGLMKDESGYDFGLWLMYQSDGWKIKILSNTRSGAGQEILYAPKQKFLMDDKYHHFALVYDDTTHVFTLYVDGKDCQTLQHPEAFVPRTDESKRVYVVGDKIVAGGFHGLIDEVRLTRRALTPSEFLSFRRSPYKTILIIK